MVELNEKNISALTKRLDPVVLSDCENCKRFGFGNQTWCTFRHLPLSPLLPLERKWQGTTLQTMVSIFWLLLCMVWVRKRHSLFYMFLVSLQLVEKGLSIHWISICSRWIICGGHKIGKPSVIHCELDKQLKGWKKDGLYVLKWEWKEKARREGPLPRNPHCLYIKFFPLQLSSPYHTGSGSSWIVLFFFQKETAAAAVGRKRVQIL